MAEKPIIFNSDAVRAILDGRMTQTRRVVKTTGNFNLDTYCIVGKADDVNNPLGLRYAGGIHRPKYDVRDVLWVRETFFREPCRPTCPGREDEDECPFNHVNDVCYGYRVQYTDEIGINIKWRPSIHMPREAARIFLRVTDVRAERVQEISEEDARKEGVKAVIRYETVNGNLYNGSTTAREEFAKAWDTLYAKCGYGWDANPYVWVIMFERMV